MCLSHSHRLHFVIFLKGLGCLSNLALTRALKTLVPARRAVSVDSRITVCRYGTWKPCPQPQEGCAFSIDLNLFAKDVYWRWTWNAEPVDLPFACCCWLWICQPPLESGHPCFVSVCRLAYYCMFCGVTSTGFGSQLHSWTDATASTQWLQQVIIKLGKWRFGAETTWRKTILAAVSFAFYSCFKCSLLARDLFPFWEENIYIYMCVSMVYDMNDVLYIYICTVE